jgi:hypothetical protein
MTITRLLISCLLIPVTIAALIGCVGIDRESGKALGTAGQTVAQTLQDQTDAARKTLEVLPEWWAVHDALVCANVPSVELRTNCLNNVRDAIKSPVPKTPLTAARKTLATVMARRAAAAAALRDAYQAFVNLATYDAAAETETAIKGAFGAINSLTTAAAELAPQGVALSAISSTFTTVAAGLGSILAAERQKKLMLTASLDLHKATDAMIMALTVERDQAASQSLLSILRDEQNTLYSSFVQAGLVNPRDALAPLLAEIALGIQMVQTPPAENAEVIRTAALISLAERSRRQQEAVVISYDAALAALKALSAEHAKLEANQQLNLASILGEAQRIKAILTDLKQGK